MQRMGRTEVFVQWNARSPFKGCKSHAQRVHDDLTQLAGAQISAMHRPISGFEAGAHSLLPPLPRCAPLFSLNALTPLSLMFSHSERYVRR